ncbi:hypothetical protein HAV15_008655 [Penicillium sp. str. |nr:hypothetical protein HAV15_008655 [Penicillium sp. str. \
MPRKPTPAAKQRVRTGCLTCRKRRRKCDEQKPSCANCEAKGLSCRYSSDLAFVPQREGGVSAGSRQAYNNITFVDDSPLAATNKEKPKAPQQPADDSQSDGNTGFSLDELQSSADGPDDTGDARRAFEFQNILSSAVPNVNVSEPPIPFASERSAPGTRYMNSAPYVGYRSVTSNITVEQRVALANGNHETDLLRHFRYYVGPWIDTGDPELPFGLQVLLLSRANRALQAAVLALAAGQRLLVATPNTKDLESSQQFRKEAEESLPLEYDLARYAGHTLLMLQDALPCWTAAWEKRSGTLCFGFTFGLVGQALISSANQPVNLPVRLTDLAGSMSSSKPPLMPFRSLLRRDGTLLHHTQYTRPQTVNSVYKHILCLLGHCLALIHGDREMPSPHTVTSPNLTAFPSLRQSHSLSQWTFLWSDCQKWYNERPVNVQQIVDIRGGEADQIDPDHDSSFPILIYTTPMALVANAVYHVISLLLLTHKPRLLKSLPGPRSVTSHIWHAQSIAGIAASNDSPEQWDPILVASLLTIAKEMTHESQQAVLLERFSRITATTGIKLDRETNALQAAWNLARYEEEFDDEAHAMIS